MRQRDLEWVADVCRKSKVGGEWRQLVERTAQETRGRTTQHWGLRSKLCRKDEKNICARWNIVSYRSNKTITVIIKIHKYFPYLRCMQCCWDGVIQSLNNATIFIYISIYIYIYTYIYVYIYIYIYIRVYIKSTNKFQQEMPNISRPILHKLISVTLSLIFWFILTVSSLQTLLFLYCFTNQ